MLYIDVSEFVRHPIMTGIQRVVRRLITNWPANVPARFCFFDLNAHSLRHLHRARLESFARLDGSVAAKLGFMNCVGDFIVACSNDTILIPEVFYETERIAFYQAMSAASSRAPKIKVIVFDIMPWSRPEAFQMDTRKFNATMPYLRLTAAANGRAFISTCVSEEYSCRILRGSSRGGDIIVTLGADAIPLRRQKFDRRRGDLLCIGSFDGKKGQELVYEAFIATKLNRISRLVLIGSLPAEAPASLVKILRNPHPSVSILLKPHDETVARMFKDAIGTIFIGANEGYGLPPVESLWLGVPVIAFRDLPSLQKGGLRGVLPIDDLSVKGIQAALLEFDNPAVHELLWEQAQTPSLQSWKHYAMNIAEWASK